MNAPTTQETRPSPKPVFFRLNRQMAFDTMLTHMREQGRLSRAASGFCAYRGIDNRKCVVGALIPDDVYCGEFEYQTVEDIANELGASPETQRFLRMAQRNLHDTLVDDDKDFSKLLAAAAERFAALWGLDYTAPSKKETL